MTGCSQAIAQVVSPSQSPQPTAATSIVPTNTRTIIPSEISTPTITHTPTTTLTPSLTPTTTITPTPTKEVPRAVAMVRAFCRYGPGKAYLYAHELKQSDGGEVQGRNYSGTWLWIKPDNLDWNCWTAASVVEVTGNIKLVHVVQTRLPHSTLYQAPEEVGAARDGDSVKVYWSAVWMTKDDDRGYLIEATICQNGQLISVAVQTNKTSYEFTDERSCSGDSSGKLYTVEKHGYTDPVDIPWP